MRKKFSVVFLMLSILALVPAISIQAESQPIGYMDLYLILEMEETWKGTTELVTWEGTIEFEGASKALYMRFFFIGTGIPRDLPTGSASHFGEIW